MLRAFTKGFLLVLGLFCYDFFTKLGQADNLTTTQIVVMAGQAVGGAALGLLGYLDKTVATELEKYKQQKLLDNG